jgi:hypothetical protein
VAVTTPDAKTDRLAEIVFQEYLTAKTNGDYDMGDFEANLDCLDGKRTEKEYEWMSDISTHDYAAIVYTEASGWANQMFQSRDFVDPILEGDRPEDAKKCQAAKKVINKTLNNREIFHYQKYMRARTLNATASAVHALCWWEKDVEEIDHGTRNISYPMYLDENGQQTDQQTNVVRMGSKKVNVKQKIIRKDYFNYDIIDPRNIFYSNNYCYTLQDKDWVIIRSEESYETLKSKQKENGYFNLDQLKELNTPTETDTSSETYNKDDQQQKSPKPVLKYFDKLMRFGKSWAVVTDKDSEGYPKKITSGYDELGDLKDGAELVETITEIAYSGSSKVLIRFQPQFCRTKTGRPYRPLLRGLCYIHPVKDVGVNDGKYLRQLQVAVDDTINMSNDRVQLATMPTMIGKRYVMEDNDTVKFQPEHTILVDDPATDLVEVKIRDNIQGALQQVSLLMNKMNQLPAVWATTMGGLPDKASTTATAVAGGESRTNLRQNYKSLTWENTYDLDFYWMMLQMTWQFAEPETAQLLMGDDAQYFDPDPLFNYLPVSSNIEMEQNKAKKIQNWDQFIGRASGMAKVVPEVIPLIAHAFGRICDLQGDEIRTVAPRIERLAKARPQEEGKGFEATKDASAPPTSNQNGLEMSQQEEFVRAM